MKIFKKDIINKGEIPSWCKIKEEYDEYVYMTTCTDFVNNRIRDQHDEGIRVLLT